MTIKELILELSKFDENINVLLSKDEEGNGFGFARAIEEGMYDGDEMRPTDEQLDEELKKKDTYWSEEDRASSDSELCVVIWP